MVVAAFGASDGPSPAVSASATRPVNAMQPAPTSEPREAPRSGRARRGVPGDLLDPDIDLVEVARTADAAGAPGTRVAAQRVVPTPDGIGAAYRVLYRSTSLDGRPIVVSGVVYVPRGQPPRGGWPLVSWARGTSGTADRCAPSRWVGTDLVPITLAQQGIVAAATDYEGLGTPGIHPYLVGDSEGRSVLDIVGAVDGLPDVEVRREIAVWGHSQGGHAALFARELAGERLTGRRLAATVAIAPPSFIPQAVDAWATKVRAKGLGIMALAGIEAAYPEARLDDIVQPAHLAAVRDAIEEGCTDDISRRFADVDGADLFVADPTHREPWARLLHEQEPAQRPGSGPVLLVQGALDGTLPPEMSEAVEAQMCARGEPVTRWLLPDAGHGEAIASAWDRMVRWTTAHLDPATSSPVNAATTCGDPVDAPPAG